jgi:hypothetical protein
MMQNSTENTRRNKVSRTYSRFEYTVQDFSRAEGHQNGASFKVCGRAFELIYCISENKLKQLKNELKTGLTHSFKFSDRTRVDRDVLQEWKKGGATLIFDSAVGDFR